MSSCGTSQTTISFVFKMTCSCHSLLVCLDLYLLVCVVVLRAFICNNEEQNGSLNCLSVMGFLWLCCVWCEGRFLVSVHKGSYNFTFKSKLTYNWIHRFCSLYNMCYFWQTQINVYIFTSPDMLTLKFNCGFEESGHPSNRWIRVTLRKSKKLKGHFIILKNICFYMWWCDFPLESLGFSICVFLLIEWETR